MTLIIEDPKELQVISNLLQSHIQDAHSRIDLLKSRYSSEQLREYFGESIDSTYLEFLNKFKERIDKAKV